MSGSTADRRPLRVLLVTRALEPGGTEGQFTELALGAHPQRLQVTVATLFPTRSRRHLDRLAEHGVPVHTLSSSAGRLRGLPAAARALGRLIRRTQPDVVYAWLEETAAVAVPVARLLRVPVAVSRRNVCGSSMERYAPLRMLIRRIEASARIVTANSDAVRDEAIRRGIDADRIRVVLNGLEALPPLEIPPAPPVRLGYLAHLRAEKGHLRLLGALARLRPELDWRADLGGSGPLEGAVRARIDELGLAERVSLLGSVSDARDFWTERHVAVLLSDHEGSSNTLIEAAMAGRPLVATDVGGNPAVVTPGTGMLVAPDDPAAIAGALDHVIADAQARAAMGANGHQQAAERFSLERFVNGHVAALAEAAARRG